jgi:hypothetical protein
MFLTNALIAGVGVYAGISAVEWVARRMFGNRPTPAESAPMQIVLEYDDGSKQAIDVPSLRPGESHKVAELSNGKAHVSSDQ